MRLRAFVLAMLLTGCAPNQPELFPRPEGDRELPRNRPAVSGDRELSQKVVNAKEAPATLVAADRTSCQVTEQKFRETIIGTKVWCLWR